jgi:hypothetical protein
MKIESSNRLFDWLNNLFQPIKKPVRTLNFQVDFDCHRTHIGREPSNDYFIKILFLLSKWFQTRRFLWNDVRAPTTLKSEGEVTSLSSTDKREVRDNREK